MMIWSRPVSGRDCIEDEPETTVGVQAALVDGQLVPGDVRIQGGVVAAIGIPAAPTASGIAVPGFIDLHINGFAGVDFLTAEAGDYTRVGPALAATGVTAYMPTFVSAAPDAYLAGFDALADADHGGERGHPRILGVHLEGPFISPRWAGAHDRSDIRSPDPALADRLCDAGPVRVVTLAPELPRGLELVGQLTERGVVVSCGHSDATAEVAHHAFDRGARAITHIYNAHRRWRPRDPGLAGAALVREEVTVQAILDDVHLAPETGYATALAARERFCLVTDAIACAGVEPHDCRLGNQVVYVEGGEARLPDGTLAGSLLTMDQALANLVAAGASLADAVHAASRVPAMLIGRPDLGRIAFGLPADIIVLDDELRVTRTLIGGREARSSAAERTSSVPADP
jgi:N-acetylglucosamine-6-phosphate deacetylase